MVEMEFVAREGLETLQKRKFYELLEAGIVGMITLAEGSIPFRDTGSSWHL